MRLEVRPAQEFEDVRALVGPKRPDATVCWCLSYRIPSTINNQLRGTARGDYVAGLLRDGPIGELAYDGDEPVGWAAGEYARVRGAPAVEAYPLDNRGAKVDLTMAYAGLRASFERAGFVHAAYTGSVLNGFPRVLMRRTLAPDAQP